MSALAQLVRSVDVDVPRRGVYDQWQRLEHFPLFLGDVRQVRRLDDRHVRWTMAHEDRTVDWVAEILEEVPHRRVEWQGTGPGIRWGLVSFVPLSDLRTRVTLRFDVEPSVFGTDPASAFALLSQRVEDGLLRFKSFVETIHRGGGATPAGGSGPVPPAPPGPPPHPRSGGG